LHGGLSENNLIEFEIEINKDDLTMQFTDPGKSFDPGANVPDYDPLLSLESAQRQGLGLVLIDRIMDTIDYSRDKGACNILALSKKLIKGGEDNDH
jgi:anti-sigma regulatory factor (Ser/Thr protein kinase)